MGILNIILNLVPILIFVALTYVMLTRNFNDNQLQTIQLISTILCFVLFLFFNICQKRFFNMVIEDPRMALETPIARYIFVMPFIAASGVLYLKDRIFNNKQLELIGILGLVVLYFISSLKMPLHPLYFTSYEYGHVINMIIYTILYELYVLSRFLIVFIAAKRYKHNDNN